MQNTASDQAISSSAPGVRSSSSTPILPICHARVKEKLAILSMECERPFGHPAAMSGDYFNIGDRLRQIRMSKGLTQEEVADRAGIDPSYVSHLEGKRKRKWSAKTAAAIAEGLGIPPWELFGHPAPPPDTYDPRIAEVARRLLDATPEQLDQTLEALDVLRIKGPGEQ